MKQGMIRWLFVRIIMSGFVDEILALEKLKNATDRHTAVLAKKQLWKLLTPDFVAFNHSPLVDGRMPFLFLLCSESCSPDSSNGCEAHCRRGRVKVRGGGRG